METATTNMSSTHELAQAGQSPWLDSISRELLNSGKLRALIKEKGLLGVTSNPTIFEKAITTPGGGYEKEILSLFRKGKTTLEVYDALTISDIQAACDLFDDVFCSSSGEHGFVSLEVRPDLAHDEERTVEDAMRLFTAVNRPNVMIKVPATEAGIEAFRTLTANGINVNVTLIFSLRHYQAVLSAYMEGLELYRKKGGDVSGVHSVASVFVSRFDTTIDKQLNELIERESDKDEKRELEYLKGKAAVANAKLIYQEFLKGSATSRWQKLSQAGANVQKVLWGSTSVKNPAYSDLLYVETLVGRDTVNTMPAATLDALLDHGKVRAGSVEEAVDDAEKAVESLKSWGIELEEVGDKLQHEGLLAFVGSFDSLMKALEGFRGKGKLPKAARFKIMLPPGAESQIPWGRARSEKWVERFYKFDPTLWKSDEAHKAVINNRLGWLKVIEGIAGALYELDELSQQIRAEKVKDVVLLGMGGSSLAPEVMSLICNRTSKQPRFHVLDTTDTASLSEVEGKIDLKSSLFIAASKSGTTVETMSQYRYFFSRVAKLYGRSPDAVRKAGCHFIAITDDGSRLQSEGYEKHFRKVFINPTDIGGRYSALSLFGLVPASLIGIDFRTVLHTARKLLEDSRAEKDPEKNDPVALGLILGGLASRGVNKLTIWSTPRLASFGAWLEQLIAESTGKEGKGILPVDGDVPGDIGVYGADRVFLVLKEKGRADARMDAKVAQLKRLKLPVIISEWSNGDAIGAEFLRWEIVTAIASAVLGINPFDEPNVKESKDNTTRILTMSEREAASEEAVVFTKVSKEIDFETFFEGMNPESYVALLAYIQRSAKNAKTLTAIQTMIRDHFHAAVTTGFGPRYLHSIGQLYKGGPQTGRFVVFINTDRKNIAIPDAKFGFTELKKAQAAGDCQAFQVRDLPLLAVDLGRDAGTGLETFRKKLNSYLAKSSHKAQG